MTTAPLGLSDCVLVLRPEDHVGVATRDLQDGTVLTAPSGGSVDGASCGDLLVRQSVPRGRIPVRVWAHACTVASSA